MTAAEIIARLGLQRHPEGGWYRRTFTSSLELPAAALAGRHDGPRPCGTAIYYLLTADDASRPHRLRSDELFHFHVGDPVEQLQLRPDGGGALLLLGPDLAAGMTPQLHVPAGVWQAARLRPGGSHGWTLLGCTVTPGFDFADFEPGDPATLAAAYPAWAAWLRALPTPGTPIS